MTNQEIKDRAPDGATHYKGRNYYKFNDYYGMWFKFHHGKFVMMFKDPMFRLKPL